MHENYKKGFTLIELLVVLTIIALLSSLILAGMGHIQKKSRDTRRITDINAIFKALQIYQTGHGRVPIAVATTTITGSDNVSSKLIGDNAINKMPTDPLYPDYAYTYITNNLGTDFTIYFCLETNSIPNYSQGCNNSKTP